MGWDGDGDVALQRPVPCRVIGSAVLPALPDDATPRTPESPDSARVFKAALARLAVERLGQGCQCRVLSASRETATRSRLLHPSGTGRSCVCRLFRDRGLAGVSGERVPVGIASAAVADLSEQLAAVIALWACLNRDRKTGRRDVRGLLS